MQGNKDVGPRSYDERVLRESTEDQIAIYYELRRADKRKQVSDIIKIIQAQPNENILDVGSGVGTLVFHLAKEGASCIGVDYSFASIKVAEKLISRYKVTGRTRFVCADVTKLPFCSLVFDKIVSADFIEHINSEQKEKVISEIYRVLKPNGIVVIATPNRYHVQLGVWFKRIKALLKGESIFKIGIPHDSLHIGLTSIFELKTKLKKYNLSLEFRYYPSHIPLIDRFISSFNKIIGTGIPLLRDIFTSQILVFCQKK